MIMVFYRKKKVMGLKTFENKKKSFSVTTEIIKQKSNNQNKY